MEEDVAQHDNSSQQLFTRYCGRNTGQRLDGTQGSLHMAQESGTQVQLSLKFSSAEQDSWSANWVTFTSQQIIIV